MTDAPEQTFPAEWVVLRIGNSSFALTTGGEILETVEHAADGTPIWTEAGICDSRGIGGWAGHMALIRAMDAAEQVSRLGGGTPARVDDDRRRF